MAELKAADVVYHPGTVTRNERSKVLNQQGCTIWFTGLSASGKSTIAVALEQVLIARGHPSYVLDGDNIRHGLNAGPRILKDKRGYSDEMAARFGLAFSAEDREENIRRIGDVAALFADSGMLTIASFISPYAKDRDAVRAGHANFPTGELPYLEVYVNTPLEVCEERDPKGMYKKARAGEIKGFTGIDDPYEEPQNPDLVLPAHEKSVEECVAEVINLLHSRGLIREI